MIHYYRYPIIDNFSFIKKVVFQNCFSSQGHTANVVLLKNNIIKLQYHNKINPLKNYSILNPEEKIDNQLKIKKNKKYIIYQNKSLIIKFKLDPFLIKIYEQDKIILESDQDFIGYNGKKTVFQFKKTKNTPFWGFGEKTGSLNKKGKVLKMWNLDLMSEMPDSYKRNDYDPAYISIPFFITFINNTFWGFLLNNPCQTFFNNGKDDKEHFYFGAYEGICDLYIIHGPHLKDIMLKLRDITGRMEMPPLWSLGHHQSRWSYNSLREIKEIIKNFKKHKIPLSSIWLDIDYMQDYRIFTWDMKRFKNYKKFIQTIHQNNIHTMAIIDPGIKKDNNYFAYKEGLALDLFCKTHNKKNYIGLAWSGITVFPDFTLRKARKWWSKKIARFLTSGVSGIWIDMNDPSTGDSEQEDMLFKHGTVKHSYYHNQYANLMAQATKKGFQKFDKTMRSFILTRSAYTGIQKYSAVWTGDNVSSWNHLQISIPEVLNLSLSGVSFSGADIGGFIDDVNEQLLIRWYQANFLFPFFRNHSAFQTRYQEPYQFSKKAVNIIKKYINLRYKFLPYLYNLFYEHYLTGAPVLRPLFYEFIDKKYFSIDDEFMVGPYLLQAPVLCKNDIRQIILPSGYWYDYFEKKWVQKKMFNKKADIERTFLFIKDGAIIPVLKKKEFHDFCYQDFQNVEFHIYAHEKCKITSYYYEDDGRSMNYKKGFYNLYKININIRSINDFQFNIHPMHKQYKHSIGQFEFHIYYKDKVLTRIVQI